MLSKRLIAAGFEQSQLASTARVLGIDLTSHLRSAQRPTKLKRLDDGRARLERVDLLPVSADRKVYLAGSLAVTKIAWGAWNTVLSGKTLSSKIRAATGGGHRAAAPSLFFLLAGHNLAIEFAAGFQAFLHYSKVVRADPRPWPRRSPRGTWLGTVRSWLQSLGWREDGDWKWSHPLFEQVVDLSTEVSPATEQFQHHLLRESWRRKQFEAFLSSGRRDAAACRGASYCERRVSKVRKAYGDADTHTRACLTGAVVSDARMAVIQGNELPSCQWCNTASVPHWHHMCWECPGFSDTRPQVPVDPVQRVLGWPSGHQEDALVLQHVGSVRKRMLDRRYRGL